MASNLKDILLVGYGAVGAMYALILKKSGGARVTVVARGNYDAVKVSGMHFQSRKYGDVKGWRPDRLFPNIDAALDRPYAYVVLAAKAIPELQRTPALLRSLLSAPYSDAHPQPTYVLLQNGLGVEIDLYDALKQLKPDEEPRIISTAVWIGTNMLDKNVIEHNEFDRVSMGVYRPHTVVSGNTPAEAELLQDFNALLAAGGSETSVVPEIQRIKFQKNMWNAVLGASAALSRYSLREFFRPPHLAPGYAGPVPQTTEPSHEDGPTSSIPSAAPLLGANTVPFLHAALSELGTLGAALFPASGDVPALDPELPLKTLAGTAALHARADSAHVPSMLLDMRAGRPMEVEHVVGAVVRMARGAGVDVPRIETLYALLLVVQNEFLRKAREGRTQL